MKDEKGLFKYIDKERIQNSMHALYTLLTGVVVISLFLSVNLLYYGTIDRNFVNASIINFLSLLGTLVIYGCIKSERPDYLNVKNMSNEDIIKHNIKYYKQKLRLEELKLETEQKTFVIKHTTYPLEE